jgi:hypothetical protein
MIVDLCTPIRGAEIRNPGGSDQGFKRVGEIFHVD